MTDTLKVNLAEFKAWPGNEEPAKLPLDSELAIVKMQLATAQHHAEDLLQQAQEARDKVAEISVLANRLKWGVMPGTLVQVAYHNSLQPAPKPLLWKVIRVRPVFNERFRPWVDAVKQRKDGSWGTRSQCLFDDWVAADLGE